MTSQKLILGTVQLGLPYGINNSQGMPDATEAFRILDTASEGSIQYLDTAAAYGTSEEVIGAYHQTSGKKTFSIITKFHCGGEQSTADKVHAAIAKLRVKHIDVMMFHSFRDYKENPKVLLDLVAQKEAGLIGKIGVSVYTNDEMEELLGEPHIEVVQSPFNMLDNTQQREESFKSLQAAGKLVHTRSAFLQGLFFKDLNTLPERLQPLREDLFKLHQLQNEYQIPMHQMALGYALAQPSIDGVLIGVDTATQLESNLGSAGKELSPELLKTISTISVENVNLLNPSNWNS